MDRLLQRHYGQSLAEIETAWIGLLQANEPSDAALTDLLMTLRYFDVMRDYQQAYDPTAYFLQAWLPYPVTAREKGLVADFLRRPLAVDNIALETMLQAIDSAVRLGDYDEATLLLDSVARVVATGRFGDPLAQAHLQLVEAGRALDFEVQRIAVRGREAQLVLRPQGTNEILQQTFIRQGSRWVPTG